MAAVPYIWWRGKRFTPAMRDAIKAAEQRAGFTFNITQGGFNSGRGAVSASAGTHDGDALDVSIRPTQAETAVMVEALRWAGIAAWLRTTKRSMWGTRAQGFGSYHVHGVPNGWGLPSRGARLQADRYRGGGDGLASNQRDLGPGHTYAYRNQRTPRTPATPGLPPSGVEGPPQKPTPAPIPVPAPKEELSMADIKVITDALAGQASLIAKLRAEVALVRAENAYTKLQNEALAASLDKVPLLNWQFPEWRTDPKTGKQVPVMAIQVLADIKTQLAAFLAQQQDPK